MPWFGALSYLRKERHILHLSLKCLPNGALPYTDDKLPTKMMTKLFEDTPYLGLFPRVNEHDNLIDMTFENIPGIKIGPRKIILRSDTTAFISKFDQMDKVYNNPTPEGLEEYSTTSFFLQKYLKIIERIKPKETVFSLLGPFTMSQMISIKDDINPISDKYYRKFLTQAICLKAMWLINKIKDVSPETLPIVLFDEPKFNQYGMVKKDNEDVTKEVVVHFYAKIFEKLRGCGAAVGVQSFEKCDWQVIMEAAPDLISFDAYNNSYNLNIIADKVNHYLANGGHINWGMIPVQSENAIKSLAIDSLYDRFISTIEALIDSGVSERLAHNRSMVSTQGNIDSLPLIFAEKALILSTQLAQKIPTKS